MCLPAPVLEMALMMQARGIAVFSFQYNYVELVIVKFSNNSEDFQENIAV